MSTMESKFEQAKDWFLIGLEAMEEKSYEKAETAFESSLKLVADRSSTLTNLAAVRIKLCKYVAAFDAASRSIEVDPQNCEGWLNCGLASALMGKHDVAVGFFQEAINLQPNYPDAYTNLGASLSDLGRLEEALACHERAIALKPDYADAFNNRGNVLKDLKLLDAALSSLEMAISLNPNSAFAFNNLGNVLQDLNRLDEALKSYDKAISIKPDSVDAIFNKSMLLLLMGDFQLGLKLFEWRLQKDDLKGNYYNFPEKVAWRGQADLEGKTLLIHSEQGMGDVIQFCRYLPRLESLGAKLIFEVPKPLVALISTLNCELTVFAKGGQLPQFDAYCPLMSLPLVFKTELHTIPSHGPYLFVDVNKRRAWEKRLGEKKKLRVGLVWNGGFRPNQPKLRAVNERRNIPLKVLSKYLAPLDVSFYSLQKGEPAESEIKDQEDKFWPLGNFTNFAQELNDFSDTAALIDNLDLVISVDTSTAHLAAAIGKPTWILNRFDTCWRWLVDRQDSPWYPSVKLYRQDSSRRWETVLERVVKDLTLNNQHFEHDERPCSSINHG